jgi:hypothetical protein
MAGKMKAIPRTEDGGDATILIPLKLWEYTCGPAWIEDNLASTSFAAAFHNVYGREFEGSGSVPCEGLL